MSNFPWKFYIPNSNKISKKKKKNSAINHDFLWERTKIWKNKINLAITIEKPRNKFCTSGLYYIIWCMHSTLNFYGNQKWMLENYFDLFKQIHLLQSEVIGILKSSRLGKIPGASLLARLGQGFLLFWVKTGTSVIT